MRTKTLVLTAALGIFGVASSMAQVYSVNAVGFYTLNLKQGFNLVANQLINGGNTLDEVLPATSAMPDGSAALTWNEISQTFNPADTYIGGAGWFDNNFNPSTTALVSGKGAFLQLPSDADVVLVGEVPQGVGANALSLNLVPGFQIISQLTPQSIGLSATGFPAADGDSMLFWNTVGQRYTEALTYIGGAGWFDDQFNPVDPTPLIGEAMFYQRAANAGTDTWTRDFSVNP